MRTTTIDSVFDISRGNKLDYNKMNPSANQDGGVIFVNRSGENNGFGGLVERVHSVTPYRAGLITVALGGSALASFVQPTEFYTSQNVDVLTPKVNFQLSLSQKLYYCKCIELNRYRYSTFGREANRTLHSLRVPHPSSLPTWLDDLMKLALDRTSTEFESLPGVANNTI